MEHVQLFQSDYSLYPGEYVPLFDEEEVEEELKDMQEGDLILPPVNVNELPDSYTVEVAIPGVKREDLSIHVDKNLLSVRRIHSETKTNRYEKFHLHEFNYQSFDRQIMLPEDVDGSFARAEYAAGMLCIHVPRTKVPGWDIHTRIAIY